MKTLTHAVFGVCLALLSYVLWQDWIVAAAVLAAQFVPALDALTAEHLGHRAFHTAFGLLLTTLAAFVYSENLAIGIAVSHGSHLLLDLLKGEPLQILWPVTGWNARLPFCLGDCTVVVISVIGTLIAGSVLSAHLLF